jgi:hypothetical protein
MPQSAEVNIVFQLGAIQQEQLASVLGTGVFNSDG